MTQKRLTREELLAWLDGLTQDHRVIAPVRGEDGLSFLQEASASSEVDLAVGRPVNSIKWIIFSCVKFAATWARPW